MKRLNTILFIACIFSSVYPQILNIMDNRGFKQGHWELYEIDTSYPRPSIAIMIKNANTDSLIHNEKAKMKEYEVDYRITAEGKFVNNRKQSVWRYYNTENNYKSIRYNFSKEYYKGDSVTFHNQYYKGSLIKEIEYLNDTINGYYKSYYKNGNLKSTIEYKMGTLNGSAICFYESGKVYFSGRLLTGTDYYEGTEYYESGSKRAVKRFAVNYILSKWINK